MATQQKESTRTTGGGAARSYHIIDKVDNDVEINGVSGNSLYVYCGKVGDEMRVLQKTNEKVAGDLNIWCRMVYSDLNLRNAWKVADRVHVYIETLKGDVYLSPRTGMFGGEEKVSATSDWLDLRVGKFTDDVKTKFDKIEKDYKDLAAKEIDEVKMDEVVINAKQGGRDGSIFLGEVKDDLIINPKWKKGKVPSVNLAVGSCFNLIIS